MWIVVGLLEAVWRRQRGQAVRALDLQVPPSPLAGFVYSSPKFKSSTMLVHVNLPGQLGFLTLLCLIWIICFSHLLGPTSISAINAAEGNKGIIYLFIYSP